MKLSELTLILPELYVLGMSCLILMVVAFLPRARALIYGLSQLTVFGAFFFTFDLMHQKGLATHVLNGMVVVDAWAHFLKAAIYLITSFVFIYSRNYVKQRDMLYGEYYVLALFAMLGMMVLVSSANLITLYLGIELLALPLYAMAAMHRDRPVVAEAAMKFFVMGALASGMMLYGMSIIYGVTGTLDLSEISTKVAALASDQRLVALFGMLFILVGVAFEFGAVPFHMWVPDVYQGAPTAVTMFIGSAPKIAGLGLALRVLAGGFAGVYSHWQELIALMAVLSLGVGNIIAIAQTNLKRMLGYSTIAHIGYLFLALLAGPETGYQAAGFYVVIYALMTAGAFGIIIAMSGDGELEDIADYRGLGRKAPWTAMMMMLIMFSMAGVPPTAGFYAKFLVINSLIEAGMVPLAVIAMAFAIIGAFYYLRVVKTLYFDEPDESVVFSVAPMDAQIAISINGLLVLALGMMPLPLLSALSRVI